jgi:hypothetical protein
VDTTHNPREEKQMKELLILLAAIIESLWTGDDWSNEKGKDIQNAD